MKKTIQPQHSTSRNFTHASNEVAKLLRRLQKQELALVDISGAQAALEALPLATGEFAQAVNRLRNAHRYACVSEEGASHYELQLLAASLKHLSQRYA
jgi:hypothetical protein